MKSPLIRRIPRQFKSNLGKYLGIFVLISLTISIIGGYLVAASSIERIIDNMRSDYSVEDGRFTTNFRLPESVRGDLEGAGVRVYDAFSRDVSLAYDGMPSADAAKDGSDGEARHTARLYVERSQLNKAAYAAGSAPADPDEVSIDRVYAEHHGLGVGDRISLGGIEYTISGICTLPDYAALFENTGDFVFNAQSFTVGEVTEEGFTRLDDSALRYNYSFACNNRNLDDSARSDLEEDMIDILSDNNVALEEFVDAGANPAITYPGDDVAGDQKMYEMTLLIIISIMALTFVVITNGTIERESAVIGTLLASGYRKAELVRHYLVLPVAVSVAAAIVGNIGAYAVFTDTMRGLYYNSYSLPPYVATWNPKVFVISTLVPLIILCAITVVGLVWKMRATPLDFLRHQTTRRARRAGAPLPERLSFSSRFRLRVILSNPGSFVTLFAGILAASFLLMSALSLLPSVDHYADNMRSDLVAQHSYMLKAPLELEGSDEDRAEWAAVQELSQRVDMASLNTDAIKDKLTDILRDKIENRVRDALKSRVNASRLASEVIAMHGQGTLAGLDVSRIAQSGSEDCFAGIDPDAIDFKELVDRGILSSAEVDLTDCGLGVIDLCEFDVDAMGSKDLDFSSIDFTGISPEEVGLTETELGGMSVAEFFRLVDKADKVDSSRDAHPVNTVPISSQVVDQAEKYAFISLEIPLKSGSGTEAVPVYGIEEDSRYWDMDVSGDEVVAGAGLLEKYDLSPGDTVVLHDKYAGEDRTFTLARSWGSESNMGIYMSRSTFNKVLDEPEGYFNGYASNEPLSLDRRFVLNDLTPAAMDKISNQLKDSMGSVVKMIRMTSIVLFVVLMYLLTKTVLDRSSRAISHLKVFGYRDREVNRLYLRSITGAVVAFVIACIPLNFILLKIYVRNAFADSAGNMPLVFDVSFIMETVVLSLVCYAVIALLHVRRVRRVPLSLALKTQE